MPDSRLTPFSAAPSAARAAAPDAVDRQRRGLTGATASAMLAAAVGPVFARTPTARAVAAAYPATPRRPVEEVWHGDTVVDDYRWLEQTDSAEVQDWVAKQNALTARWLGAHPRRAALLRELKGMTISPKASHRYVATAGGRSFALRTQPPKAQPSIVMLPSLLSLKGEKLVLDPTVLDPSGKTAIDWFVPSHDGKLVAVCLSEGGSEDGHLRVFETGTGRARPDRVPRASYATAGGSAFWHPDGSGFWYTRYPQGSERPPEDANFYQQVWFHKLGTPSSEDRYETGRDFPRIAEIVLSGSDDGRWMLADVANGDGGDHGFELRTPDGRWLTLARPGDGYRGAILGRDARIYAIGYGGTPRGRVVALPLERMEQGFAGAQVVVPEGEAMIKAVLPTATRLYLEQMVGGPSEIRAVRLDGQPIGPVPGEPVGMNIFADRLEGDTILVGSQSFVASWSFHVYDPGRTGRDSQVLPQKTVFGTPPPFAPSGRLDGIEVVREDVVSKDGTRVPISIVRRLGTPLDGKQPLLLTGYGGYGISMQPWFSRHTALWLRHGGIWVLAHLRGGGEFGEDWHQAGRGAKKQNVFDDFIAAAEHLIQRGYTSSAKLAAIGGSNGGLLMGAVLTQRPELFRAVVAEVGVHDMLRVEFTPNGEFNTTEFGSIKDPDLYRALKAYSPIENVRRGTRYPAVLLTTGANDGRVAPWMSYKLAAKLQAADPGSLADDRPVLLRVASDAGHGMGTSFGSAIGKDADVYTFLFDRLGMKA